MSKRVKIVQALAELVKTKIDGTAPYVTDLQNQCFAKLKFWDEINEFPSVYITPGTETREYLPSDFKWGILNISIKVYCKQEDGVQEQLETLLADLETFIDANNQVVYDTSGEQTTDIMITSITTDEGLLAPYGVGEINLQVRYEVL